jgi:hypothetical protein
VGFGMDEIEAHGFLSRPIWKSVTGVTTTFAGTLISYEGRIIRGIMQIGVVVDTNRWVDRADGRRPGALAFAWTQRPSVNSLSLARAVSSRIRPSWPRAAYPGVQAEIGA